MTQFDGGATPLYHAFSATPVLTAYTILPAQVDLLARNPAGTDGANKSGSLDFSAPDRADAHILNAILWAALKPGEPMPSPVHSVMSAR